MVKLILVSVFICIALPANAGQLIESTINQKIQACNNIKDPKLNAECLYHIQAQWKKHKRSNVKPARKTPSPKTDQSDLQDRERKILEHELELMKRELELLRREKESSTK